VDSIIKILRYLSSTYAGTPMAARSNLQVTASCSGYFRIQNGTPPRDVRFCLASLFWNLEGPLVHPPRLPKQAWHLEVQEDLAKELGLNSPDIAWHTERDRIAEVGAFFALVTGTCGKIALDIKLLMQTEVAEAFEPYAPHRGTMPQKRIQFRAPASPPWPVQSNSLVRHCLRR
jgi:3-carboxy-cis,cis-muconate cycloisomerase